MLTPHTLELAYTTRNRCFSTSGPVDEKRSCAPHYCVKFFVQLQGTRDAVRTGLKCAVGSAHRSTGGTKPQSSLRPMESISVWSSSVCELRASDHPEDMDVVSTLPVNDHLSLYLAGHDARMSRCRIRLLRKTQRESFDETHAAVLSMDADTLTAKTTACLSSKLSRQARTRMCIILSIR